MANDLLENYKKAYDNALGFGAQPALILVDFVQAYFDRDCELYADVDEALASALRVVSAARAAGIPVIYTNVVYAPGGVNGGVFYRKAKPLHNFQAGSPMGAWPQGISPLEGELVISKQYPSAFFGTSLSSTLTAAGVDTLIMTGLTTSGCIRATCIDACSYGFVPMIVEEACGDRHDEPHNANLFDMNAKYGDVISEAATLDYLAKR
ncbi:MAG: isochorismatase family protein [Gammaproteobacteria bacterium]